MYQLIYNILDNELIEQMDIERYVGVFTNIIFLILVVILSVLLWCVVKFVMVKLSNQITKHIKSVWMEIFCKNRLFHRVSNFTIPVVIHIFSYDMPVYYLFIGKLTGIITIIVFVLLLNSAGGAINEIYCQYEISKIRPIQSLIQVVLVVSYIIAGIIAVAVLLGQSPMVLIGGIGAMTAVTSIVFKDPILGFIAGIQLISNDMIHIGDWIEVPKCSANGTVIELSMTTVKVENFDRTITSIPAYTLISDAFINWRGMINSGGRRIKRAVYIDASTIRLCNDQMIEKFRAMPLLKDYINFKLGEKSNRINNEPILVNTSQPTNMGVFRIYVQEYLRNHPNIKKDMIAMARQTEPSDKGVPLELYCFTDTTVWLEYEGIQSDIFEHLYSVISEFGLQIYQNPSGGDIRGILQNYQI